MKTHHFELVEIDLFEGLHPPRSFTRLVGRKTGLIKELFQTGVEPGDPQIFNVTVIHSHVERLVNIPIRANLRAAGAGLTLPQAFAAASGEVMERYACYFYNPEDLIFDTYANLQQQGREAIGPDRLQFFSKAQLATPSFPFQPFTEDTPLAWAEGRSLVTGRPILVPAQYIYFSYHFQHRPEEPHITYPTSSGCACASSLPEAWLKGLYEQIERDAVMLTWYARLSPPMLDIEGDLDLRAFLYDAGFVQPGRKYHLRYITLDIPITVVLGVAELEVNGRRYFVAGSANIDPRRAAIKALLELGQGVPFIKYIMVDQPYADYSSMSFDNFDDNLRLYADPDYGDRLAFLLSSSERVDIRQLLSQGKSYGDMDFESALQAVVALLAQHDMEPIAFDHTTPDIAELGFYVGRVFVPELVQLGTPAYPFLGSRRLYELPAQLGLRDRVLTPDDLNPDYHPYP